MAKKKPPKLVVIKDTREQKGWIFHKGDACDGMKLNALKTGDYTLEGFEDAVCIERKRSVEEIANNVGKEKKRFDAEMLRIQEYPFKYIICEFSMKDVNGDSVNVGILDNTTLSFSNQRNYRWS